MRPGEDARSSVLLVEVAQEPRDVESNGLRPAVAHDALVPVKDLRQAPRTGNVDLRHQKSVFVFPLRSPMERGV